MEKYPFHVYLTSIIINTYLLFSQLIFKKFC